MLKNKNNKIGFDAFLFDTFFKKQDRFFDIDESNKKRKNTETTKKVKKEVSAKSSLVSLNISKKKINKKASNKNDFNEILNKFFPGDYKSNIDIDDKMVKKWSDTFSEMKKDARSSRNALNSNLSRKEIDECRKVSLTIKDRLNINNNSIVLEREIGWSTQLAALSLAVFAISSMVFNSNPGMSKNALDRIGKMTTTPIENINKFKIALLTPTLPNYTKVKYVPKIEITKKDLASYIVNNHKNIKTDISGKPVITKINKNVIGGKIAGVVEIRDQKIKEKQRNIHNLINEGEQLVFEMLRNILNK
ncbi:hypothetical protein KAI92_03070 [Candidatus Parcubacteria bacterium]|nr:hypothetical protein [Candidatus Parcubacteria bacterium]